MMFYLLSILSKERENKEKTGPYEYFCSLPLRGRNRDSSFRISKIKKDLLYSKDSKGEL